MEEWQSKKDNQEQTTDDTTTSKNRKNSATGKQAQENIHNAKPHFHLTMSIYFLLIF